MSENTTEFDTERAEQFANDFSAGVERFTKSLMEDNPKANPLAVHVKALELFTAGVLFGLRDQIAERKLETAGQQVPVDVIGMQEFDRLCNVLATIYIMTDDPRIKAFVEAEVADIPLDGGAKRPVHHTFDILANLQATLDASPEQSTYIASAAMSLCEALADLDDAREQSTEKPHLHVVLDTIHKYLDRLVNRISYVTRTPNKSMKRST